MFYLDVSLDSPTENIAFDEALLCLCDAQKDFEALRTWITLKDVVVVGKGRHLDADVDVNECRRLGMPVIRRGSGGGTVLLGPGCLNYSLVLRIDRRPELGSISATNRYIMAQHQTLLSDRLGQVGVHGVTDLTVGNQKFSGNAQHRKRRSLLFHGTFLIDFDIKAMASVLRMPKLQPDYRAKRTHEQFVTNCGANSHELKQELRMLWRATENLQATDIWNRLPPRLWSRLCADYSPL